MGKVVKGCGCVLGVVVLAVGGVLAWSWWSGGEVQKKFFTAVHSGDPAQVTALFADALKAEVDEPVLARWMETVRGNLGPMKGLDRTAFKTSGSIDNGATVLESEGTVQFEKGEAKSRLKLVSGKIVEFAVESERIPKEWFTGPTGTALYRERGKECLTFLLTGQVGKAFDLIAEDLRGEVPKLEKRMAEMTERVGGLKSVAFESEAYEPGARKLKLFYQVACDRSSTRANVTFAFEGFKAKIRDFDISFPVEPGEGAGSGK